MDRGAAALLEGIWWECWMDRGSVLCPWDRGWVHGSCMALLLFKDVSEGSGWADGLCCYLGDLGTWWTRRHAAGGGI